MIPWARVRWVRTAVLGLLSIGLGGSAASAQSLAIARASARAGNADAAIGQTQQILATTPRSAEAHALLCHLHGSLDQFDAAIRECEAARDLQPSSSGYVLQLARAYGARADHAGAFTGMRMVGKIRDNFELAAQLDPKSVEALSDLGEFYVEAPGVVGGGVDKARSVVARLEPLSPARAHRLAGMIAAHTGDTATAEREFAQELSDAHAPEAYVDLANFYRKRKMFDEAAQNAVLAMQKDTKHGPDTVDAARILIDMKRNYAEAQKGLREYLATSQASMVTPAARVHTLLGQALAATGDNAGAQQQYAAALSVAHDYAPAKKLAQ